MWWEEIILHRLWRGWRKRARTHEEKENEILEEKEEETTEEITPTISCNALVGITTPQTLNLEGYIKKKKVIVLIDSGSTHNLFILR